MAKKQKQTGSDRLYNKLAQDMAKAKSVSENVLPSTSLPTVDASRSQEIQNLLNQFQSLSDPSSSGYAGKRSDEMTDYVSRLKAGLGGYDSQELNALRAQRLSGMDQGFQSGRATLMRGQNGLGTNQRGAQLAELAKNFGIARAGAENQLFVQGAEEKQRRLKDYGNVITDLGTNEYNRAQDALKNYATSLNSARSDELDRQKINLRQEAATRATQVGSVLGTLSLAETRRNNQSQNRLMRQAISKGRPVSTNTIGAPQSNPYADAMDKLISSYYPEGA